MRGRTVSALDLTAMTPAEIDALLFDVLRRVGAEYGDASQARQSAERCRSDDPKDRYWRAIDADHYGARAEAHAAAGDAVRVECDPYIAEYERRGGWTRYTVCASPGGHYHRTGCSRIRHNTELARCAYLSGMTVAELIDTVGHRACTGCCSISASSVPALSRTARAGAAKVARKTATHS
jgi:hypothetical protein